MEIKELLAKYNENNAKNSALTEYINKNNLFQTIGKERSELVHSKFIANLIAGTYFRSGHSESTAMHFLDILLKRSAMQKTECDIKKLNKGSQLEDGILTRKSGISTIEYKTEHTLSKYIEDNKLPEDCIERQFEEYKKDRTQFNKLVDNIKKSRLDIYIKMKVGKATEYDKGRTVEIFIENKVECKRNDFKFDDGTIVKQTEKYYKVCSKSEGKGQGNRPLQLFVYLSPVSQRELDNTKDTDVDEHFIQINYQDILNLVIEPLLADTSLTEVQRMRLTDYVNCLELPSLSDEEDASNVKDLSIMATSEYEKNLIKEYLQDQVNKEILDAAIGNQLKSGYNFYEYKGHRMLSFNEALNKALADFVSSHSEFESLKRLDIIEKRGGNTGQYNPFLMYCPVSVEDGFVPYDLYVYKDKKYYTVSEALEQALNDLIDADKAIDEFNIFDPRGRGTSTSVYAKEGIKLKNDKFIIRNDIGFKHLGKINSELYRLYSPNQAPQISQINAEQLHSYLAICKEDVLHVSKEANYSRVGETNYYYRNDAENYCEVICTVLEDIEQETEFNKDEKNLLTDFYKSNKPFLLSVYKIQMENTTDNQLYEYRKKCFNELCRDKKDDRLCNVNKVNEESINVKL